jgi:hypothetical protein
LKRSPLLIAQEWLPTEFDWRIHRTRRPVLFAARYYMARGHWQIRSEKGGVERYGKVEAVPRAEAPRAVTEVALRAARLIGRGMYGVDLKETARGPVVIEVNDNPNLDADYEDAADGDDIYQRSSSTSCAVSRRPPTGRGRAPGTAATGAGAGGAVSAAASGAGGTGSVAGRRARGRVATTNGARAPGAGTLRAFEVAGLELEYPTVDEDLDVVALVEPAFRAIAGRGTSDIELDRVGFSNEIADHVFEVKTLEPVRSLRDAEDAIVGGIRRFSEVLQQEWSARLLPTAMHPWFDPMDAGCGRGPGCASTRRTRRSSTSARTAG